MTQITFDNFATRLEKIVDTYPERVAFKLPVYTETSSDAGAGAATPLPTSWTEITYAQFWNDIQSFTAFWASKFAVVGAQVGDVVAVWFSGLNYIDFVTFYGLQLAGFTPLLIRATLTDLGAVEELTQTAGAKAIFTDLSTPQHTFIIPRLEQVPLSEIPPVVNHVPATHTDPQRVLLITLSSGSTGRLPKLIRYTTTWVHHSFDKADDTFTSPVEDSPNTSQDVFVPISPLPHAAQRLDYSNEEMYKMIDRCGLNRAGRFPHLLAKALEEARSDPSGELVKKLKKLRGIYSGGVALDP